MVLVLPTSQPLQVAFPLPVVAEVLNHPFTAAILFSVKENAVAGMDPCAGKEICIGEAVDTVLLVKETNNGGNTAVPLRPKLSVGVVLELRLYVAEAAVGVVVRVPMDPKAV